MKRFFEIEFGTYHGEYSSQFANSLGSVQSIFRLPLYTGNVRVRMVHSGLIGVIQ
jgi:hypothetical protein